MQKIYKNHTESAKKFNPTEYRTYIEKLFQHTISMTIFENDFSLSKMNEIEFSTFFLRKLQTRILPEYKIYRS